MKRVFACALLICLFTGGLFAFARADTSGSAEEIYAAALLYKNTFCYEESIPLFESLNGYADSAQQLSECGAALSSLDRTITFPETEITLYVKQRLSLKPEIAALWETAPRKTVCEYLSLDANIVKVDRYGAVTGLCPGDAYITCRAQDNLYVGSAVLVHVVVPVSKLKLTETKIGLQLSESNPSLGRFSLSAVVLPEDAFDKIVTWQSSNEKVAIVSADGEIRAVGIGRAVISAVSSATLGSPKKATCAVTVAQAVETLTLDSAEGTVYVGKTLSLKAMALPKNAGNKALTWSSGDESVATVSAYGKVKGVSPGTAIITATAASGVSAQFLANVQYAPTTMRVSAKATLVERNSVGGNWSKEFLLDGVSFTQNAKITVEEGQTVTLACLITENDKYPESDGFTEEIVFTAEALAEGVTLTRTLYVEENRGRYAGNVAQWQVTIAFKP